MTMTPMSDDIFIQESEIRDCLAAFDSAMDKLEEAEPFFLDQLAPLNSEPLNKLFSLYPSTVAVILEPLRQHLQLIADKFNPPQDPIKDQND